MSAGHWLDMVKLLVAVGAERFELRKVTIKKVLAGTLLTEPNYVKIHFFSVRQNCIVCFIKARSIKLANKDRAIWVLF